MSLFAIKLFITVATSSENRTIPAIKARLFYRIAA